MEIYTNVTKTLFNFFGSLGYEVYLVDNVREGAIFPYIAIDYQLDYFGEDSLIQGRIWDNTNSRTRVNSVGDKLATAIGRGITLKINNENGYIYLRQGSPFIQPLADDTGLQANYFNIIMKTYY